MIAGCCTCRHIRFSFCPSNLLKGASTVTTNDFKLLEIKSKSQFFKLTSKKEVLGYQ